MKKRLIPLAVVMTVAVVLLALAAAGRASKEKSTREYERISREIHEAYR